MKTINDTIRPSLIFKVWCHKYPDDYITEKYGGEKWKGLIGSAGHFVNALFSGDLKEAFCRADFEHLKKLQAIVGTTKAEYLVEIGYWPESARGERYVDPDTGEVI